MFGEPQRVDRGVYLEFVAEANIYVPPPSANARASPRSPPRDPDADMWILLQNPAFFMVPCLHYALPNGRGPDKYGTG